MVLKSAGPIDSWRGDVTLFRSFFGTRPHKEIVGADWGAICNLIAPRDGPTIPASKERGLYFVPCALADAPFTGKTLARALENGLPSSGKQRSAAHVTAARMIVADIDGISDRAFEDIQRSLESSGIAALLYSSYSFGLDDKPGYRGRIALPVDMSLAPDAYSRACTGLNHDVFGGAADPSGFRLHQQQGVWATSADRKHLAFRLEIPGGVASAAALMSSAPAEAKRTLQPVPGSAVGTLPFEPRRVDAALSQLDPNSYQTWIDVAIWLKAAYGDAAQDAWTAWGETAGEQAKAMNESTYHPAAVWARPVPYIAAEAGAGALFGAARDAALKSIQAAASVGQWSRPAVAALKYLRLHHSRLYDETFGVAG